MATESAPLCSRASCSGIKCVTTYVGDDTVASCPKCGRVAWSDRFGDSKAPTGCSDDKALTGVCRSPGYYPNLTREQIDAALSPELRGFLEPMAYLYGMGELD